MKKFFLVLVLSNLSIQAQAVKVIYSQKEMVSQQRLDAMPPDIRNAKLAELKVPKLYTLEVSDGISLYEIDKSTKDFNYESKESKAIDESSFFESKIIVDKKNTPFFYYKELNDNLMLFKLTNAGIDFDGKDKLIVWNWEVTNDVKMINGYNCRKAISRAFNAYITAWFTEDIPVNAGPEKFDGLPGLILYVDTRGLQFIAEKIEILDNKIVVKKPVISTQTVTLVEMYDLASKKFSDDKNLTPKKQGNTTIKTETY
jgi:GLPGLI family protein